ncbi:hypothetical protein TRIUR3_31330 [Triticum urartu]|uniref:Ubiquitin-like protease family profile domain-containing protein n=1 Tax=Triticum urartu TaxID=4572 RepID=M7ZVY7_TRIUA|nr:hypothetical protein TRIUR3_31330 [Triticum urartu]
MMKRNQHMGCDDNRHVDEPGSGERKPGSTKPEQPNHRRTQEDERSATSREPGPKTLREELRRAGPWKTQVQSQPGLQRQGQIPPCAGRRIEDEKNDTTLSKTAAAPRGSRTGPPMMSVRTMSVFPQREKDDAAHRRKLPNPESKSRHSAGRLHDIVKGLPQRRKDLICTKMGNLLNISKFSAPEGLLEWIVDRIDPKLEKGNDLDDETFFRTFFLVALATNFTPATGNMVPLEYLGSLEVASKIIYMDHLDFPESSLSTHRINYSLPRSSHVIDADFKFVMLADKSRLSLNPYISGTLPFHAPEATPYAVVAPIYQQQSTQQPYVQQKYNDSTNHPAELLRRTNPPERKIRGGGFLIRTKMQVSAFYLPVKLGPKYGPNLLRRHISHNLPMPLLQLDNPQLQVQQPTARDVPETIGTQTHEKKNRKKRACLRKTEDTRLKKLKGYHISYEDFREAMKPRGFVDTHTMELYIRQFNLEQSIQTCGSAIPTKYAFSQSLTAKLLVPEDQFIASKCLREFDTAYQDGSLKSKDLSYGSNHDNLQLYFSIPPKQHWIVCCINLLYKQINIFDSSRKLKNDEAYEISNNLVTNFVTFAAHAKAFTKLDFMKFTCFNPPECPQQKTQTLMTITRLSQKKSSLHNSTPKIQAGY